MSRDRDYDKDRREKADWVVNMASVLSILSWVIAFGVWIILDIAAPERENFFTRTFGFPIRTWWDATLLPIAFALLVLSFLVCIAAFIFNATRMRRKSDKYRKSIIIIGVATFIGGIAFLIRFGSYIFF